MRQFTDATTESLRSLVDIGPGGTSEQLRQRNDQDAVTMGSDDLAVGNEKRVQQSPRHCLLVGIEQYRGFDGQFQTRVVNKTKCLSRLEKRRASRVIPQNIPHTDPTVHDRTDEEQRKAQ